MYILVPSTTKYPPLSCPAPATLTPPQHAEFFYFLDLPPEIRNIIYEYIFANSTITIQTLAGGKQCLIKHTTSDNLHRFGMPALLQVSKQVRSEAAGVFYANTKIVANETQRLITFLKGVDRKYRRKIKCVQVDCSPADGRDLSSVGLKVYLDRLKGYLAFGLRYAGLDMVACEIEARIVRREAGEVLWPKQETVVR